MSTSLAQFQSDDQIFQQMQTSWANELNPLIRNSLLKGQLLKEQALVSGANIINHRLGRKLQGWVITRKRAAADIFDMQDSNQQAALTLNLNSSASVVVDIYVF